MKYITIKKSYRSQPMTPNEFLKSATIQDVEDLDAVIAGNELNALCMVTRAHDDELQIVIIEPAYFTTTNALAHLPTASDFWIDIQAWRKSKNSEKAM